jgi:hypothetical protein
MFAHQGSNALYQLGPGQYGSSLCSGSRALADGEPALGGLLAREPSRSNNWPFAAGLTAGVGILAAVVAAGLAILRARRQAGAE